MIDRVKEDCEGRRKDLQERIKVGEEVQELLRLYRGGQSLLGSSFHAEQTRELTEEEKMQRLEASKISRQKMQM